MHNIKNIINIKLNLNTNANNKFIISNIAI